jgi:hypothetical protein
VEPACLLLVVMIMRRLTSALHRATSHASWIGGPIDDDTKPLLSASSLARSLVQCLWTRKQINGVANDRTGSPGRPDTVMHTRMRLSWPYVDDIFTRPMQGDIARLCTLLSLSCWFPSKQGLHARSSRRFCLLLLIPSLLLPALIVNLQILLAY